MCPSAQDASRVDQCSNHLHYGHEVLQPFDVEEDARDFLASVISSGTAPESELTQLIDLSFAASTERWNMVLDCATSLQQQSDTRNQALPRDLLFFLGQVLRTEAPCDAFSPWCETDRLIAQIQRERSANAPRSCVDLPPSQARSSTDVPANPWRDTDRLIAAASQIRADTSVAGYVQPENQFEAPKDRYRSTSIGKRSRQDAASHYWSADSLKTTQTDPNPGQLHLASKWRAKGDPVHPEVETQYPVSQEVVDAAGFPNRTTKKSRRTSDRIAAIRHAATSPFFTTTRSSASPPIAKPSSKRRRPGIVSCVPFPPLDSPSFGLIQEKVAHEPFWLLAVVTFLIRTKGKDAVPVFYELKKTFPSPSALANDENAEEILDMIRHLGLCMHRLRILQKYAKIFMEAPPQAGKVYRVKNYDLRDIVSNGEGLNCIGRDPSGMLTPHEDAEADKWEIGHMTHGKYALDSWRIFCRDKLLGRAEGWNGEGNETLGFQPEWMRVRPDDKELRAYLRWMWMREGFEWDPTTGERTVLRPEMQIAVNERRVEYDDAGGLRIVDQPRHVS